MPKEILMAEPGRPRVLDEIKRSQVVALIASGYGLVGAAKYVGCDPRSIRREAQRDDAFDLELREAEKQAKLCPLEAIRHKAHTHWRAAAWLLERTEPKQFSKRTNDSMKPSDINRLFEAVLDRFILELSDDPVGKEWLQSAAKRAKEKAIERTPCNGRQYLFEMLAAKSMEYLANHKAARE
jgi:hypothetical protein